MDDAVASTLLEDVEALKVLCAALMARVVERDGPIGERDAMLAEKDSRIADRDARIAWLQAQLLKLRKRLYGRAPIA